jgi:CubicO group peptidase (beta-lactamase class C family)
MKHLLITLFLTGSTLFLYGQTREEKLQKLFEAYSHTNQFNGTVLISQGEKLLLNKGYGFKSIKDSVMNTPETIFQIGSLTKQFTAAAILKLQEDGKLKVQDKVSKYFPGYPKGDSITIEHLLTHTSGIYNYTNDPAFMLTKAVKPITRDSMLALFKDKPLKFSPGTKWSYSNSGYMLLGYIIEKASKKSYERYIRETIFKPLKMKSSGFDFAHSNNPNKATGYDIIAGADSKEAGLVDSSVSYAAGAIYSTTADLYQWHKGLLSDKLLQKSSLEKALTPYKNKYGYGWFVDTLNGKKVASHGGGIFGFNTYIVRVPQDDIAIVLLNNISNSHLKKIADEALAILYDKLVTLPEVRSEITLSTDALSKYTGVYELAPQFFIKIFVEDGKLYEQATGQQKLQLFAQKQDYFFLKIVDAQIEFEKDESGKINSLTLFQGGKKLKGNKVQ